jgi:hypothetical protein
MSKLRTTEDLIDRISSEHLWRKREISEMYLLIARSENDPARCNTLIRCAILILYGHWEGFVKNVSSFFVKFVTAKKHDFKQICLPLQAIAYKRQLLSALTVSDIDKYHELLSYLTGDSRTAFRCNHETVIQTGDNLNSKILKQIVKSLGLEYNDFATKEKLIDEVLMHYRNNIAHGKDLSMTKKDFHDLKDAILEMLNLFKNQIENVAVQGSYLR